MPRSTVTPSVDGRRNEASSGGATLNATNISFVSDDKLFMENNVAIHCEVVSPAAALILHNPSEDDFSLP